MFNLSLIKAVRLPRESVTALHPVSPSIYSMLMPTNFPLPTYFSLGIRVNKGSIIKFFYYRVFHSHARNYKVLLLFELYSFFCMTVDTLMVDNVLELDVVNVIVVFQRQEMTMSVWGVWGVREG